MPPSHHGYHLWVLFPGVYGICASTVTTRNTQVTSQPCTAQTQPLTSQTEEAFPSCHLLLHTFNHLSGPFMAVGCRGMVPLSRTCPCCSSPCHTTLPACCGLLMQPRAVLPHQPLLFDRMLNLMTLLPWHEELNGWLCEWWGFACFFHRRRLKASIAKNISPRISAVCLKLSLVFQR